MSNRVEPLETPDTLPGDKQSVNVTVHHDLTGAFSNSVETKRDSVITTQGKTETKRDTGDTVPNIVDTTRNAMDKTRESVNTARDKDNYDGVQVSSLKDYLNESVYKATKYMCDLSFAKAYLYNIQHYSSISNSSNNSSRSESAKRQARFVERMKSDENELVDKLGELNFKSHKTLFGRTGSNNQREDATGVISCNEDESVIIVAFHGTVTINKKEIFRMKSDWGSHYNFLKIKAAKKFPTDVSGIPDYVKFHRGYCRNYLSVHDELLKELKNFQSLRNESGISNKQKWVVLTGHSKGACMATIASAVIKSFMMQSDEARDINIGVIAFSSPRVIKGSQTENWFYEKINRHSVIRINVDNDFAIKLPSKLFGYTEVGSLHEEKLADVKKRKYENGEEGKKLSLFEKKSLEHYITNKDGYLMFGSHLAPSFMELNIKK